MNDGFENVELPNEPNGSKNGWSNYRTNPTARKWLKGWDYETNPKRGNVGSSECFLGRPGNEFTDTINLLIITFAINGVCSAPLFGLGLRRAHRDRATALISVDASNYAV
jgi:hypothetical protein